MGYIDVLEKQWKRYYFNDDSDFHIKYYKLNAEINHDKIIRSEILDCNSEIVNSYQNNLLPTIEIFDSNNNKIFSNGINDYFKLLETLSLSRNKSTKIMIETIDNLKVTYREKLDLIFRFQVFTEVDSYLSYPDSQYDKFHDYITDRNRGIIYYDYYLEEEDNEEILKEWYDHIVSLQIKGCDYDW